MARNILSGIMAVVLVVLAIVGIRWNDHRRAREELNATLAKSAAVTPTDTEVLTCHAGENCLQKVVQTFKLPIEVKNENEFHVKLATGAVKIYTSRPFNEQAVVSAEQAVVFSVVQYQSKNRYLTIEAAGYEDRNYLLLNLNTGREIQVSALPLWSPDSKYFASLAENYADEGDSEFLIWSCNESECRKAIDYANHGGVEARWINATQLQATAALPPAPERAGEPLMKVKVSCTCQAEQCNCVDATD